jgi:hypothetical protein
VPSKKQRRRRQKDRRHEYEYVYVDEEGQEVEVDEAEVAAESKGPRDAARNSKGPARPGQARGARAGRKVEPPSWRRVGRRALILAPVLVLLMYLIKPKDTAPAAVIIQAIFFLLIFLPFSYAMDTMLYRSYLKRTGQAPPPRDRGGAKEPKAKT